MNKSERKIPLHFEVGLRDHTMAQEENLVVIRVKGHILVTHSTLEIFVDDTELRCTPEFATAWGLDQETFAIDSLPEPIRSPFIEALTDHAKCLALSTEPTERWDPKHPEPKLH